MVKKIIISAFSVYPDQKSSEGIVNKNWLDILAKSDCSLVIISIFNNYIRRDGDVTVKRLRTLFYFYNFSKKNKRTFKDLLYRTLNKFFRIVCNSELTIHHFLWIQRQSKELQKSLDKNVVIWSRVLPIISLRPVIKVYKKNNFPFIVNVNDPIVLKNTKNKSLSFDEIELLKTKESAQAWTFPSSKLADRIAKKYNFDRSRCFVIPHAMKNITDLYKGDVLKKSINVLYAGTFYKSAFTNQFQQALIEFSKLEISNDVQFTFVLSQYDNNSIDWLKNAIPNVKLKFKLEREEVLNQVKKSDCILVVDAKSHVELLKGKLIEAISYGVPILALTTKNSTMDKVVTAYGGFSVSQDQSLDILNKIKDLTSLIKNKVWLKEFYIQRETVLEKISEEKIYQATKEITDFAFNRFNNNIPITSQLELQEKYNWP